MELNSNCGFVLAAVGKLNCEIGSIYLKFQGIPISVNLIKLSTWSPVFDSFKKKLSFRKHKLLSFGGRLDLWENGEMVYGFGNSHEGGVFLWEQDEHEDIIKIS
ncbi:hypothetical protein Lal_00017112 [Lupinus albus]|nr:hypothetical protein Lal_00017112 [Lupinus albus]